MFYEVNQAEIYPKEEVQPQPPKQPQQPKIPQQTQNQVAKDEAAKAAQEAAKAAKEASQGLFKGLSSFGSSVKKEVKTQKQQQQQSSGGGGLFGGLMKAAEKATQPPPTAVTQPPKPKVKPQDPNYPKPYTNNMNARQRWQWAYRRLVQVNKQA